jgi:hypothetical protein
MPFRRRSFRSFRRPSRHYQWVRVNANDTAMITSPGHYTEDLLLSFRSELGLGVQLPEITIWRIRIKISVAIKWIAAPVNFESAGVIVGIFVEDMANTLVGVETHPYAQSYMMYQTVYYQEAVMQGERQIAANNIDFLSKEFDIKARRKLRNLDDTLLLQVGTTGAAVSLLDGLAWNASILTTVGRR